MTLGNKSETKLLQLDFWTALKEYAQESNEKIKFRTPRPQQWTTINFGVRTAEISLTVNTKSNQVACEIYIPDSKPLYEHLFKNKDSIESALQENLEWQELPTKKACRVKLATNGTLSNESEWQETHDWLINKTKQFQKVFKNHCDVFLINQ